MKVGDTIYLDYQASTPIDPRVRAKIHLASETLFANPHSADHVLGWQAAASIGEAADAIGKIFGLQGDDVLFVSGARVHDTTCGEGRKGFELKTLHDKDLQDARFPPRPSDDHAKPTFRSEQDTIGDPDNYAGRSRKWPNR